MPSKYPDNPSADDLATALEASIQGKVVLITGPSVGGLGYEAARVIAKHGALVVLASRSQAKLDEASAAISAETPSAKLRTVVVDLASFASIRSAAASVRSYSENIDVIINNSALLTETYAHTTDGFETTFQTNYLGPFLLTSLLRPKLAPTARIVNITSAAHAMCPIRLEDYNFQGGKDYEKWMAYANTKTADMLFSLAISQKWNGVEAFSVNPGVIATNIWKAIPFEEQVGMKFRDADGSWTADWVGGARTMGQGAAGYIAAAFDPSLTGHSGGCLVDAKLANEQSAPHATDADSADKLWALSEKLVGLQ